jgi:hypothetical protein
LLRPEVDIATRPPGYALIAPAGTVDADALEAATDSASAGAGHPDAPELEDALDQLHGRAFGEFSTEEWAYAEAVRLDELRLTVAEQAVDARFMAGEHRVVVADLERLVREHPLRERFWEQLVCALHGSGRSSDALRRATAFRSLLRDQLGLDPSPRFVRLEREILDRSAAGGTEELCFDVNPPSFLDPADVALLGREDVIDRLTSAWQSSVGGRHKTVVLAGEGGIGKTQLLAALATIVKNDDGVVIGGECDQFSGSPLQPWFDALSPLIESLPPQIAAWALEDSRALASILPRVGERLGESAPLDRAPLDVDRHMVFDAAASVLRRLSSRRPMLVVLEDLHWADDTTLLLFRHLARRSEDAHLLLVGSFRSDDPPSLVLQSVLDDLRRERDVAFIPLAGLAPESTFALVASVAGGTLSTEVASRIHLATHGNPFFVTQLVTHLLETGSHLEEADDGEWPLELGLPQSIRDVTLRRLSRLDQRTRALLEVAAVAGQRFAVEVIAGAESVDTDVALTYLDAAEKSRLVRAAREDPSLFEFSHALVRATLVDAMTGVMRSRTHERVARSIEASYDGRLEPWVSALAYHWLQAPRHHGRAPAIRYALLAAASASGRYAWEDTKRHCNNALMLLESKDRDLQQLWEAQYLLATAHLALFNNAETVAMVTEACRTARRLGDFERLIRSVGVLRPRESLIGLGDEAEALLADAVARLPMGDSPARALGSAALMTHAIESGRFKSSITEFERTADEALELARRLHDERTELDVLLHIARARTGLPGADRLLTLGRRIERLRSALWQARGEPLACAAEAYARLGHRIELERMLARSRTRANDASEFSRDEVWPPFLHGLVPFIDGDLDTAWNVSRSTLARVPRASSIGFAALDRMTRIRWLRGHESLTQDLERAQGLAQSFPQLATLLALHAAERGNRPKALALAQELLNDGGSRLHWNGGRPRALHDLAETVGLVDDASLARTLRPLLEPYDTEILCSYLITVDGAAATALGIIETVVDQYDDAHNHFSAALEIEEALRARLCTATTRVWWAHLLRRRRDPGDIEWARELETAALAIAAEHGANRIPALNDALMALEYPT